MDREQLLLQEDLSNLTDLEDTMYNFMFDFFSSGVTCFSDIHLRVAIRKWLKEKGRL